MATSVAASPKVAMPASRTITNDGARKAVRVARRAHIRDSLTTPGRIVIVVRGPHSGRRVILLRRIADSGRLAVVGPPSINGVGLIRVSPSELIATSTVIDMSKADAPFDFQLVDKAFGAADAAQPPGNGEAASKKARAQSKVETARKLQSTCQRLDNFFLPLIKATPDLKAYLGKRFGFLKGIPPHRYKF